MRFLFSCTAAEGHFRPLVPLAEEAVRQGHEVVFASADSFRPRVGADGFELLAAGIDRDELESRYAPYLKQLLTMEPGDRRPYAFAWRFGAIDGPAKVDDLLAAAKSWEPDVIVHESADLAAPLVAELLGVHSVHQGFGRRVPLPVLSKQRLKWIPFGVPSDFSPRRSAGRFVVITSTSVLQLFALLPLTMECRFSRCASLQSP